MILLVTALYCEAKPIINYFKLKREQTDYKCELYSADDISLIISGTGIVRSSASTSFIIALKGGNRLSGIVNLGICGAKTQDNIIGSPIIFNKVVNESNGRSFYPDMLIDVDIKEGELHSFSDVVLEKSCSEAIRYVDMEAAGFMEAAMMYLPPHKVQCLKTVSDHMDSARLEPDYVGSLIEKNIATLEVLITGLKKLNNRNAPVLAQTDIELLSTMCDNLKFTISMKFQLRDLFQQYLIHTGISPSSALDNYRDIKAISKKHGKEVLDELRGVLAGG